MNMLKIAISYRRSDSAGTAGRIHDRLIHAFSVQDAFIDYDNIPIGVDFRQHILDTLSQCDVLLVIIGQRWLEITEQGRRIDDEEDIVRFEIVYALHGPMKVVPVLVHGALMPKPVELPDSIKKLTYRNAVTLDSGRDFHPQMDRLIKDLQKLKKTTNILVPEIASNNVDKITLNPKSASFLEESDLSRLLNYKIKIGVHRFYSNTAIISASFLVTSGILYGFYYKISFFNTNEAKIERSEQSETKPLNDIPSENSIERHDIASSVESENSSTTENRSEGPQAKPADQSISLQTYQADSLFSPKPENMPYGIQIAVRDTIEVANSAIADFMRKYEDIVRGYKFFINTAKLDGKTLYRVRIGTYSKSEASVLCGKLQTAGGQCFVVKQ